MNDKEIVRELKSGNTSVLKYCYKKTLSQVESMVLKNGGTLDDAKDLFHDSLLVLTNNCKRPEFELTSSIGTYLYSVCRYSFLNQKNKKRRSEEAVRSIYESTYELAHKTSNELIDSLIKSLDQVGEKCKNILLDYYFGKLSYDEIALGLSYASGQVVRQQKYRCIQKLKEITTYVIR